MKEIIATGIVVAGGFLVLLRDREDPRKHRASVVIVSALYCLGLLYFPLLSRTPSSDNVVNPILFYTFMRSLRYPVNILEAIKMILTGRWYEVFTTLTPLRTATLNIILFIPLGYLLPEWNRGKETRVWTVLAVSLCVSVTIEIIQLLMSLGWCDVDDLLCNLLGGMIGYQVSRVITGRAREGRKGRE